MNNWHFDRNRGFELAIFFLVILFVFYPVFAIADSIAINNVLSNKYPFYANEHGKYYEGYNRHSIALRVFDDEKAKNNGVVYCMPSRSCQFKKITSVSDVGIFNNVRVDYIGIIIGGLGDGSEGAGFYTVSVHKNDNYDESGDDRRKACLAKPVIEKTLSNVYRIGSDYYVNLEGCQYIATGTIVPIGDVVAADWKPTGKVIDEGSGSGGSGNGSGSGGSGNGSGSGGSGNGSGSGGSGNGSGSGGSGSGSGSGGSGNGSGSGGSGSGSGSGGSGNGSGSGGSGNGSGSGGSGSTGNTGLSRSDIVSAVKTALKESLVEEYDMGRDRLEANKKADESLKSLSDLLSNLLRGAGRFSDPEHANRYGQGVSELDAATGMANTSLGIKEGVWDVFFRKIFSLPNGNGCADFILFEGEIYQIRIGCDKLTAIKSMLSWAMMALTFWYVFTSLTSLLRKGGD